MFTLKKTPFVITSVLITVLAVSQNLYAGGADQKAKEAKQVKIFNAYPGKYTSKLMNVEAANIVNLYVEVWTGYPKKFRVTLPGLAIPVATPEAPKCQLELIDKGLDFTTQYMQEAKYINVIDVQMENTAQEDAQTHIYTDKGELGSALMDEGLARPASVKADKPWC